MINRWFCALVAICTLVLGVPATATADRDDSGASVHTLRVDTLTNPIGVGNPTPNLSWRLSEGRQTAYQIQVASSSWRLHRPDLWDSGKVRSDDTGNITYDGDHLRSRQTVVWEANHDLREVMREMVDKTAA